MFIQKFHTIRFISQSAKVKLPHPNLILDPRVSDPNDVRFDCHYHDDGVTVTLTIIQGEHSLDSNLGNLFFMRVYDPANEILPDFNSTIYTYSGLCKEQAPVDTTVAIINPSINIIKNHAFCCCHKMKKCIMYEGVETIGIAAFNACTSLDALFLPSTIKRIEHGAFAFCSNIRTLSIPINIDVSQIGRVIIYQCNTIFRITQILRYELTDDGRCWVSNNQVHQALIDFYRDIPPLHRACLDIKVSAQTIHNCIIAHGTAAASVTDHDGMTPLHILSLNPHATVASIEECFDADMSAAFVGDRRGNTPLDYLKGHNFAAHTWVVTVLCVHREASSSSASSNYYYNNNGGQTLEIENEQESKSKANNCK